MLWCQSWCQSDGTLVQRGGQVASPESGHLASLRGFTKGWSPLSCSLGVLTNPQHTNKPQFIYGLHSQRNWLLALPCQRSPRENQEGERQDTCRDEQCMSVFLSLFKLKRSANVTMTWTLWISIKTLACRWMNGWDNLTITKGKNSERTKCQIDIIRTQGPVGPGTLWFLYTTINQKLVPGKGDVFLHPCALYVVPWWTHSQLVHFIRRPTLLSLDTVPSSLSAIETCSCSS